MRHLSFSLSLMAAATVAVISGCAGSGDPDVTLSVTSSSTLLDEFSVKVGTTSFMDHLSNPANVIVVQGQSEIPSQLDDLDGDGVADELFFILDAPAGHPAEVHIRPSETRPQYPGRTQAILAIRQGGAFDDSSKYVGGSEFQPVDYVDVPEEQEQDSKWAMFEGPVWESDLVGYRYYLDDRFRTDIFGKSTRDLVLHGVEGNYHAISDWGADILKVGNSLGLGSPALATDSGLATIDNADSRTVEIVASGPVRSIIRTTHRGWDVGESSVDIVTELEIHAGQRWTEQRIVATGLPPSSQMATGIVRHPDAEELHHGEAGGILYAYTWGVQSDQGHNLGMAVLVPLDLAPELDDSYPETHVVRFDLKEGQGAYRYLTAWELEPNPIADRGAFENTVRQAAELWGSEVTTTIQ